MPGVPKAKVRSRVIMTPQHAKRLMKALIENVRDTNLNTEQSQVSGPEAVMPMNFSGPKGEA